MKIQEAEVIFKLISPQIQDQIIKINLKIMIIRLTELNLRYKDPEN
jgi:hypothetical protein